MSSKSKFSYQFQLPFRYSDLAGVMFFGNIFDLAHDVFEKFLQSKDITWKEWFGNSHAAAPIRYAESDYRKPLIPGQDYTCEVEVLEMTTSSLSVQFSFLEDTTLCACVKLVVVFTNFETKSKIPIPESLRARLQISEN